METLTQRWSSVRPSCTQTFTHTLSNGDKAACVCVCSLGCYASPQTAITLQSEMNRLTFISVMQKAPFQNASMLQSSLLSLAASFFFFLLFFLLVQSSAVPFTPRLTRGALRKPTGPDAASKTGTKPQWRRAALHPDFCHLISLRSLIPDEERVETMHL